MKNRSGEDLERQIEIIHHSLLLSSAFSLFFLLCKKFVVFNLGNAENPKRYNITVDVVYAVTLLPTIYNKHHLYYSYQVVGKEKREKKIK